MGASLNSWRSLPSMAEALRGCKRASWATQAPARCRTFTTEQTAALCLWRNFVPLEESEDFAKALRRDAAARKRFESLSYSRKLALVGPINDAKTDETRRWRFDKALEALRDGTVYLSSKPSQWNEDAMSTGEGPEVCPTAC